MPRTILVSNRVINLAEAAQAGGVAVALRDVTRERDAIWFGWDGVVTGDDCEPDVTERSFGMSATITTSLRNHEHRDFYLGYSNSVIWPVFHSRLDLAQFEAGYYPEYRRVNRRFADQLTALLRPDDVIWVHDYQLIPLAAELRSLGAQNRIGFYLHIPAPPAQDFVAIPEHAELSASLAAYDLIGLQTGQDAANLIEIFRHSLRGELLSDGRIAAAGRKVAIGSYPIGIDVDDVKSVATIGGAKRRRDDVHQIVGVDRLDYTKGLPQKFRAFGRFLEANPQYRKRVVLSQLASPTRETLEAYSDIRAELEHLTGAINGRFGDFDWTPISYIHRSIERRRLLGVYRNARVCLVTPLRDGMNLVAKEYVAAQDEEDPGVLVLSRFAGAAAELRDALIINPYNIEDTANAIRRALEMPIDERRRRHRKLADVIASQTSAEWSRVYLSALEATTPSRAIGENQTLERMLSALRAKSAAARLAG